RAISQPGPDSPGQTLLAADAVVFQPTFTGSYPRALDGGGMDLCNPPTSYRGGLAMTAGRAWVADVCNRRVLGFATDALTGDFAEVVLLKRDIYQIEHAGLPYEDWVLPRNLASDSQGQLYVAADSSRV